MALSKKFELPQEFHKVDGMTLRAEVTEEVLTKVKQFQFDESDVLSATFPKTGQTWLLTILHLMEHAELLENDQQVPAPSPHSLNYIEGVFGDKPGYTTVAEKTPPRTIKSHLPLRYFKEQLDQNPGTKVIQVIRNPKDTLVSFYHFYRMTKTLGCFLGSWEEFFDMYMANDTIYGDMFTHTRDWYVYNKSRPSSLVLIYEDMKENLRENIVKIGSFLGKNLSQKVVDQITHQVTFDNMSKDKKLNYQDDKFFDNKKSKFLRKGKVGDWREHFTDQQNKVVEKKMGEMFEPIGLKLQC